MNEKAVSISVIIPFYNVEKYFLECLNSLKRQTFQDFEVILVNDGSTDASPDIAQEFAVTRKNVSIITQKNKGQGNARNQGLKAARGKYVYFLDSDDFIRDNALERLWDTAKREDADLILFEGTNIYEKEIGLNKFIQKSGDIYRREVDYSKKIYSGAEIFRTLRQNREYSCSVCLQLIRRQLLIQCEICFPETILHEDEFYSFLVFMNSKKVYILPEALFCRRFRSGSTMTKKKDRRNFRGYQETCRRIVDWYQKHSVPQEYRGYLKKCAGEFFCEAIYGVYFRLPFAEQCAIKKEAEALVFFAGEQKGFGNRKLYLISIFWKPYCWYRQRIMRKSGE